MIRETMDSVNSFIEKRRKEIHRLMEGALVHLGVDKFDVSVLRRKGIDIFDPSNALFTVKADVSNCLSDEDEQFIVKNLLNRGYSVKHMESRGLLLLLLI